MDAVLDTLTGSSDDDLVRDAFRPAELVALLGEVERGKLAPELVGGALGVTEPDKVRALNGMAARVQRGDMAADEVRDLLVLAYRNPAYMRETLKARLGL